ncbi:MAG: hypothetical protein ACLU0V_00260 [Eggerthella lenta]
MMLTATMFLRPPWAALFGNSTETPAAARAACMPEAMGSSETNAVVTYEGSTHARMMVPSSVRPNVVPMWRRVKFAFTQA